MAVNRPDGWKLHTVISGGQTGVDQAALRAAVRVGLKTGGWAPHGWLTTAGVATGLARHYGLREHPLGYAGRTDATLRIARDFQSPGERRTLTAIQLIQKPTMAVRVAPQRLLFVDPIAEIIAALRDFLVANNVGVLNVAGNSEHTTPGIGMLTETFLVRALVA